MGFSINRKSRVIIFLTVFLILFSACMPTVTYAADKTKYSVEDNAYVKAAQKSGLGKVSGLTFDSFYIDVNDSDEGLFSGILEKAINICANFVFTIAKLCAKISAEVTKLSLNFELFDKVRDSFEGSSGNFIKTTKQITKSAIIRVGIALTVAIAVFAIIMGRTSQGISRGIQIFLIALITFAFIANPFGILGVANDLAKDMGTQTLTAINGGASNDGTAKDAEAAILRTMVVSPWRMLEFGSTTSNKETAQKILKEKPNSDERQDVVNEVSEIDDDKSISNLQLTGSAQTKNLASSIGVLAMNFVLMALFVVLGMLTFGLQALALVVGFLGIFILPLSLLPFMGTNSVKRWAMLLFAVFAGIIVAMAVQGIALFLINLYISWVDELGFALVLILFVATVLVIWFFRWQIISIFTPNRLKAMSIQHRLMQNLAQQGSRNNIANGSSDGTQSGSQPVGGLTGRTKKQPKTPIGKSRQRKKEVDNIAKYGDPGGKPAIKANEKAAKQAEKDKKHQEKLKAAEQAFQRKQAEGELQKHRLGVKGENAVNARTREAYRKENRATNVKHNGGISSNETVRQVRDRDVVNRTRDKVENVTGKKQTNTRNVSQQTNRTESTRRTENKRRNESITHTENRKVTKTQNTTKTKTTGKNMGSRKPRKKTRK